MSPIAQSAVVLLSLLVLIGIRIPIGLALGLVSFAGAACILPMKATVSLMLRIPYEFAASWEFSSVPLFLLMGTIAYRSGMTDALFLAAEKNLRRIPGGLAVATNFSAAGFGAACGSSLATTVATGRIAIPKMLKNGYDPGLATAVCACSGTLAALIPPSIPLIVYGILAEQSVAKLFFAGIMPGLLTAVCYAGMIIIRCWLNPELAPRTIIPDEDSNQDSKPVWPLLLLVVAVLGGIYGGIFSPSEAGAIGALMAAGLAFLTGNYSLRDLWFSLLEAVRTTASILFIAVGAFMLTRYMALSGLPQFITSGVTEMGLSPFFLLLVTAFIFIILGMFLDPFGVMLISISVILPLFEELGFNLIWFGIILVKYIEIGLITPPVGLNVFAVRSVTPSDISIVTIFRGVGWFLVAEAVVMVILLSFPEFTLWLPNIMM